MYIAVSYDTKTIVFLLKLSTRIIYRTTIIPTFSYNIANLYYIRNYFFPVYKSLCCESANTARKLALKGVKNI